jgi:UDP-N-acetylglucosamine diphosphorylase / glucose-1-phosphate thymidylyltransferase / UDP-N-acetylgalactosamine diphosphorylase / glucosamine-1-phosphate N-acetyltransferase / galactosamine-1-phosphate N-acetyltransferase
MNSIALEDDLIPDDLFPFTLTRSAADIRVGILTIREKWERLFQYSTRPDPEEKASTPSIPANLLPTVSLVEAIEKKNLNNLEILVKNHRKKIRYPWHIVQSNAEEILSDFELLTRQRISQPLSATNRVTASGNIFMEEGACVEFAILNASAGPIYIGRNTQIMEGAMIRGPFALCEGAVVKMGAVIYGATTIGPFCVVGGEIKNSLIFGYSNKAHEGYLGDSVIGEWCNLGAGTSNSNLKNNAGEVKVWSESKKMFLAAGVKCGLFMGDYSKSAINTAFNTGTVTGVCCNIFGEGLTPAYIPSFSWGYRGSPKYKIENALRDIAFWKKMKNQSLSDREIQTLKYIFNQS